MHPHIATVVSRLEDAREALRRAVESVPPELRNRRPEDHRWAVNDVLEHLSIVETNFTRRCADAIAAARQAGIGSERATDRAPLPDNIETIIADRVNKRTAPEAVHPHGGLDNAAAWQAVERSRQLLVSTLADADGLALSEVFTAHAFFGTLTIYQMSELIAAHESRHTAQIVEVAGLLEQA